MGRLMGWLEQVLHSIHAVEIRSLLTNREAEGDLVPEPKWYFYCNASLTHTFKFNSYMKSHETAMVKLVEFLPICPWEPLSPRLTF